MKGEEIPWHFAADVMDFARVMRGTGDYMLEQFDHEISQIEQLERHDELMFGDENDWTQKAIRSCQDAKERIRSIGSISGISSQVDINPKLKNVQSEKAPAKTSALSMSIAEYRSQGSNPAGPSDYHFYQALQHYYLSPLDIRILKAAFGSYSAFPSTILPRVERISTGHVIDEDLRRRHKYLSHLPFGCEVTFLECDWTDTVPEEVLQHFKAEIERRRKRNADKDAREEKERIRAEKEEDEKRWREARRTRRPNEVERDNSDYNPDDFQPLAGSFNPGDATTIESTSPAWTYQGGSGSAFGALASPSTSPSASRTVWGTAAIAPITPPQQPLPEPQDDGWLQGWERELLDHDAELVQQVEAASLDSPGPSSGQGGSSASKKKGKKGKKITLMSTSQRRGI